MNVLYDQALAGWVCMHVRPLAYDQPEPLGDGMALAILRNALEVLAVPDMPDGGPMGADGVCKLQKLPVLGLCGLSCLGTAIQGYTARVCRPGSRPWTCQAVSDTDSVCATVPARLWACDCMQGSAYPFRRLLAPLLRDLMV